MLYGSYFWGWWCSFGNSGLGTEANFFVTKYERYDTTTLVYGAIGTTVFSFAFEFFEFGYGTYSLGFVVAFILSSSDFSNIFGVFLTKQIVSLFNRIAS